MKDTAVIMYTHTDYSDVWPLFFGQFEELFPFLDIPKYIFVNSDLGAWKVEIPEGWQIITYDDLDPYPTRFSSCLTSVKEKYVLTHHEDMPLYFPPQKDRLESLPGFMDRHNTPFVKFTRAIEKLNEAEGPIMRIEKDSSWLFSVQVGLWDRKVLLDIYQNTGGINIWEFEVAAQMYLKNQDIYGSVWYDGETLRGIHHYDCKLYPHICTAVHKGKWTTNEYPELSLLLSKYGIDPTIRGEHQ